MNKILLILGFLITSASAFAYRKTTNMPDCLLVFMNLDQCSVTVSKNGSPPRTFTSSGSCVGAWAAARAYLQGAYYNIHPLLPPEIQPPIPILLGRPVIYKHGDSIEQ